MNEVDNQENEQNENLHEKYLQSIMMKERDRTRLGPEERNQSGLNQEENDQSGLDPENL